jgi:hypothetical protein
MREKSKKTDAQKIASIHKICNAIQKRNHMSDKSKSKCIAGISKRWHVGGGKKRKSSSSKN